MATKLPPVPAKVWILGVVLGLVLLMLGSGGLLTIAGFGLATDLANVVPMGIDASLWNTIRWFFTGFSALAWAIGLWLTTKREPICGDFPISEGLRTWLWVLTPLWWLFACLMMGPFETFLNAPVTNQYWLGLLVAWLPIGLLLITPFVVMRAMEQMSYELRSPHGGSIMHLLSWTMPLVTPGIMMTGFSTGRDPGLTAALAFGIPWLIFSSLKLFLIVIAMKYWVNHEQILTEWELKRSRSDQYNAPTQKESYEKMLARQEAELEMAGQNDLPDLPQVPDLPTESGGMPVTPAVAPIQYAENSAYAGISMRDIEEGAIEVDEDFLTEADPDDVEAIEDDAPLSLDAFDDEKS